MKFESIKAGVFFVDILGMSALTRGEISLAGLEEKIDTSIYHFDGGTEKQLSSPNQYIATWTLLRFRRILADIKSKYVVSIAQLSDCAFIWSEDAASVLLAASSFMWQATMAGLLCRGGLTYGEVIIPENENEHLGRFVLGEAVTRAATLERSGKGCRVFTDDYSVPYFHKNFPNRATSPVYSRKIMNEIFLPLTNPLDYTITDEFKWYLVYDLGNLREYNENRMAMFMSALISSLRHSPYFAWNSLNKDGVVHLSASLDFISSAISFHSGSDEARLTAESAVEYIGTTKRDIQVVVKHFQVYQVAVLSKKIEEEARKQIALEVMQLITKSW